MLMLSNRGVLANTLVIFSSDNGYMWGEHGRTEKFVPYEPSIRVPLLMRWPNHFQPGTNTTRLVSYLDILPTILDATGVSPPAGAPPMDGESLLGSSARTTVFAEYYNDAANGRSIPTWKMVRTATAKYVHIYDANGAVVFTEYYNLTNDPIEHVNLLRDGNPANDPPESLVAELRNRLNSMSGCVGSGCIR
jgi:arylsulfatase A-like enzyme